MEVTQLTEQLSRSSPLFRWFTTVILSYVTMKASFDIFILNLATAEVPFHCSQAIVNNATVAWDSINASAVEGNFSIATYECFAPSFRREESQPERLVLLQGNESDVRCQAWTYSPTEAGRVNMLMEYDFVCDRAYLANRMQTIMQAGIFLSCCFAPLADVFGRKLPFILFVYIDLASTVLVIFVKNLYAQMVLRFFMGFGSPAVLTGVAYLTELIAEDYHALHGNFYWILWVIGYTGSGVIAYLVIQWRHQLIVVATIIATGYLCYPWALVESPMWLFASGKKDAAKASLMRLFRRHGLDTSGVEEMKVADAQDEATIGLQSSNEKASPKVGLQRRRSTGRASRCSFLPKENLCQSRYIFVEIVFTILFLANAMAYFSSSFRRNFITKNPYLNVVISGALEFPATVLAWFLSEKCGRRASNMLLLIPAGLLLILVPFVPQSEAVAFGARSACALLSKFFITVSFCIVLVYGSESLPTTIRATSFVMASQVMRFGQMLAPELTSSLVRVTPSMPNFFYGGFCVVSGLLLLFLPETHQKPMPNTIADMKGLQLPSCWRSSQPPDSAAVVGGEPSDKVGHQLEELA